MKRKLTRSAVLDIVNRRARGETLTAIAEVHGVSRNAVRYRLDSFDRQPTKLLPCGTHAAYLRHLRHGERPCPPCCAAHAENVRQAKTKRAAKQVAA